jgi:cyanophycinase
MSTPGDTGRGGERGSRRDGSAGGRLVVIGGAERRGDGGTVILERFAALAGGDRARVAIVATASREPEPLEDEYIKLFTTLGVGDVRAVRLDSRERANSDAAVAALTDATGVFFTGGDQLRVATLLGGTRVDSVLHARIAAGDLVLAGTSAGAAMMSSTMVLGGDDVGVTTGSVRTGPGLEFLPGVLIDMHFAERGRLNRLLSAVALFPHELGLGIDEDTAIVVDGDRFEVVGSGSVTVIDAGLADLIDIPQRTDGPIALTGARLHVLPAGYTFELTDRRPRIVEADGGADDRGVRS